MLVEKKNRPLQLPFLKQEDSEQKFLKRKVRNDFYSVRNSMLLKSLL